METVSREIQVTTYVLIPKTVLHVRKMAEEKKRELLEQLRLHNNHCRKGSKSNQSQ